MTQILLRTVVAPIVGAALCFASTQVPRATGRDAIVAHYAAKAVDVNDQSYDGRIDIMLERWSTDDELADAQSMLMKQGAKMLLPELQKSRGRVGVVLMPGVQGTGARARTRRPRNLLFARQRDTSDGRQIVVMADQHLGIGQFERWGPSSEEELTLIELRLSPDGKGVGKVAGVGEIVYNAKTRMIEVANYAKQPVRLSDLRAEKP